MFPSTVYLDQHMNKTYIFLLLFIFSCRFSLHFQLGDYWGFNALVGLVETSNWIAQLF
uniref:Uncharacterized protein n=1 Tax=Arundo donax TaxID=35708 RepID=A0A0A9E1A9_ARUDO